MQNLVFLVAILNILIIDYDLKSKIQTLKRFTYLLYFFMDICIKTSKNSLSIKEKQINPLANYEN